MFCGGYREASNEKHGERGGHFGCRFLWFTVHRLERVCACIWLSSHSEVTHFILRTNYFFHRLLFRLSHTSPDSCPFSELIFLQQLVLDIRPHTHTHSQIFIILNLHVPSHTHSFKSQVIIVAYYGKCFNLLALHLTNKQFTGYLLINNCKRFLLPHGLRRRGGINLRGMSVLCWVHGLFLGMLGSLTFCSWTCKRGTRWCPKLLCPACPKSRVKLNPDKTLHITTQETTFLLVFVPLFLVAMPLQFCIPRCLEALTQDAPVAWKQPSTHTVHHNPFVHLLVGLVGSSGNMGSCSGRWIKWYGLIKTQKPFPPKSSSPLPLQP